MVRIRNYASVSCLLAVGDVYYAFHTREQFYPAMIFLSTSKISLLILGNLAFVSVVLFGILIKKIFFGTLREAEVERVYELGGRELMESFLLLSTIRDSSNPWNVASLFLLFYIKIFHWLCTRRIEFIETTPMVSLWSRSSTIIFSILLIFVDFLMLQFTGGHILETILKNERPPLTIIFAFQYLVLLIVTVFHFATYSLHIISETLDTHWENKAIYVSCLEIMRELLLVFSYVFVIYIIYINYSFPLHLLRGLIEAGNNFRIRLVQYLRYRQVALNLRERLPDATPEDFSRGDTTCIICREEMTAAKKLACNHLFHIHCLRQWLERQSTCPTCRAVILPQPGANQEVQGPNQQPPLQGAPAPQPAAPLGRAAGLAGQPALGARVHQAPGVRPLGRVRFRAGEGAGPTVADPNSAASQGVRPFFAGQQGVIPLGVHALNPGTGSIQRHEGMQVHTMCYTNRELLHVLTLRQLELQRAIQEVQTATERFRNPGQGFGELNNPLNPAVPLPNNIQAAAAAPLFVNPIQPDAQQQAAVFRTPGVDTFTQGESEQLPSTRRAVRIRGPETHIQQEPGEGPSSSDRAAVSSDGGLSSQEIRKRRVARFSSPSAGNSHVDP